MSMKRGPALEQALYTSPEFDFSFYDFDNGAFSSEVLQIVGAWLLVVLIAQAVELGSLSEAVAQNVDLAKALLA